MDITIFVLCALFGAIFGYQIRAAKDIYGGRVKWK